MRINSGKKSPSIPKLAATPPNGNKRQDGLNIVRAAWDLYTFSKRSFVKFASKRAEWAPSVSMPLLFKKNKNKKPLVLMGYFNMVYQYGENKFIKKCENIIVTAE